MESRAQERALALAQLPLEPAATTPGIVHGTAASLRDLHKYRELLFLLVRREVKARYKDSTLGLIWSLIRPLTMLAVYYFAIGKFLGAARSIPDFAIYIFTGLTIWQLFSEILSGCTASIVGNVGLIKKIYLPREVFPLASVGSALFNFLWQMVILLLAVWFFGGVNWGYRLLYAPLAIVLVVVWGLALGLLLAAANVYLRDVQYLVDIVLMILMWASPIVYSFQMVANSLPAWVADIYVSNPVTMAVMAFRQTFWAGGVADPSGAVPSFLMEGILIGIGLGVIGLWFAQRVFARLQGNFAQEL